MPDSPTGRSTLGKARGKSLGKSLGKAGLAVAVAFSLAACGRQVAITVPEPTDPRCAAVVSALPETIDGAGKRPTAPESIATAAWGEPPIVLRCGVSRPSALTPTSSLVEVNGVAWLPEELSAGVLFTVVGWPDDTNPLYLEVAVPEAYPAPANVLADLSPVLAAL